MNLKQPSARPPPTRLSFCPRPALVGLKRNNTITMVMMMMMMVVVLIVIMIMLSPIELSWDFVRKRWNAKCISLPMYRRLLSICRQMPDVECLQWHCVPSLLCTNAANFTAEAHWSHCWHQFLPLIYRLTIHNLISTKKPYENSKLKWNICFWSIVKKHVK